MLIVFLAQKSRHIVDNVSAFRRRSLREDIGTHKSFRGRPRVMGAVKKGCVARLAHHSHNTSHK